MLINKNKKEKLSFSSTPVDSKQSLTIGFLRQVCQRFLLQIDVSMGSRITYRRGLEKFFVWLSEQKEEHFSLTREDIINYKHFLNDISLSSFTKSLYLVSLRQFFSWMETVLIYPNLTQGVKGFKKHSRVHHKESLNQDLIKTLFTYLNNELLKGADSLIAIRNYLLFYLLLHTGMRLTEIRNIVYGDIEKEGEQYILWIQGKGRISKDAFVVIQEEAHVLITDYFQKRRSCGESISLRSLLIVSHNGKKTKIVKPLSTQSLSRLIRNEFINAGIKTRKISAHSLRHTFGILAIKAGVSLYDVQLAMRHSSPHTTQIYTADIESMKRKDASAEKEVGKILKNIL